MAEVAGKTNVVYILAGSTAMTGSTGAKVNGVDNATYSRLCELLDITQFGDSYRNRLAGLKDTSVTISGNLDIADTNGQLVLIEGNTMFIGVYPSGTTVAGWQVKAICESFEAGFDAQGKQTFTSTLQGIAAPVALPLRP